MMLEAIIPEVSDRLEEVGFEPLDFRNGRVGGERHGVFDWTWINRRRIAPTCYASMYAWGTADDAFTTQVWAYTEYPGRANRSLVRHADAVPVEPPRELLDEFVEAVADAARRAVYLSQVVVPEYYEPRPEDALDTRRRVAAAAPEVTTAQALQRTPYREVVDEVERLFVEQQHREWTNAEVLDALLERGYPTDRADVNLALSELAWHGLIRRLRRGVYRKF